MAQPEVTIEQGTLRGCTSTDLHGITILKFKGIPYAKPPIGPLRFKPPQSPEKWTGVLDATKERDMCCSRDLFIGQGKILGSENCLFLNVYTKNLPNGNIKHLKPVMFWIHGGGYIFGSGNERYYEPNFLLTEDVVLVTINYRLGIFGFLNFENPSLGVSGNAGCKDMVMALKWVQKNIANFNGDPSNVTIFGESAGGASVTLLLMSPLSKGLFHKAIAQSGCAINPWLPGTKGVSRLASILDIEHDEENIYNLLMQKTTEEVFAIQEKIGDSLLPKDWRLFGFIVEKSSPDAFLDIEPIDFLKTKKLHDVPIIFGFNSTEAMCSDVMKRLVGEKPITTLDMIPWNLGYKVNTDLDMLVSRIEKFYYGDEKPSEQNVSKKNDIISDTMFIYGICITVLNQFKAIKSPFYFYQMTVETELNFFKQLLKITAPGVTSDDIGYLFNHFSTPQIQPGSIEKKCLQRFLKLWTNFAKFGNPTPLENDSLLNIVWKPVSTDNLEYLDLGQELVNCTKPCWERLQFWKKIYANSPSGQKYQ